MEFHEAMAIVHAPHTFWNPISEDAVEDLIAALDLAPDARVLDVACGAGELLVRIAERYGCRGLGVDVSPWALERARGAARDRLPEGTLTFVESDGATFEPEGGARFEAVCLVGASWIWQGYEGTLDALLGWLAPGGLLLFGEPYWRVDDPPADYCEAEGLTAQMFTTLYGVHAAATARGLRLVYMTASSEQDWDRYEMLQSLGADRWVRAHPDHPDVDELLAMQVKHRGNYLRAGRHVLGFAQFVYRAAGG